MSTPKAQQPAAPRFHSDEPTLDDELGHAERVADLAELLRGCQPPYVVGIHGDWGTGKTSFMRKLRLFLAGEESGYESADERGRRLWGDRYRFPRKTQECETLWFEAWRYQSDPNPIVGLLQEIRNHFTWTRKLTRRAAKISFAALMSMEELTKKVGIQPSKIVEAGTAWEQAHQEQPVPSQLYRDMLDEAISRLLKDGGKRTRRLVIFVDDLDRCQSHVAFRFLEAIKIYLSIESCVFVLGIDERNIRRAVAAELRKTGILPADVGSSVAELAAADYLSKLFQSIYHLPLIQPRSLLERLMDERRFGGRSAKRKWIDLIVETKLLPPNPRKIKSFLTRLDLYLTELGRRLGEDREVNPMLALLFTYLLVFSNDVYRILEADMGFWRLLVEFCDRGDSGHPVLGRYQLLSTADAATTGAPSPTEDRLPTFADPADERLFRADTLVREIHQLGTPTEDELTTYLLWAT